MKKLKGPPRASCEGPCRPVWTQSPRLDFPPFGALGRQVAVLEQMLVLLDRSSQHPVLDWSPDVVHVVDLGAGCTILGTRSLGMGVGATLTSEETLAVPQEEVDKCHTVVVRTAEAYGLHRIANGPSAFNAPSDIGTVEIALAGCHVFLQASSRNVFRVGVSNATEEHQRSDQTGSDHVHFLLYGYG